MPVYILVNVIIIFLGLFYEIIKPKESVILDKKNKSDSFFVITSFILLFIVSAFRGDFTTDYNNYVYLFELYNRFRFFEVFHAGIYQEKGYIFLNRLIGVFTRNELYLFIVVSFITLLCFYSQFRRYSSYIWLSVLMFVTVGAFYTSFNIMRQILAVAIIFSGSKFLYERKFVKYCLVVALAALFHTSALVMLIFYFILNYKFSVKNLILIICAAVITMLYLENLLVIIQNMFYSVYTDQSYGMTGLAFTNAVLPIAILIFTLFHYKKIDLSDIRNKIWVNAVIFYAFFSILGLKVEMVERISDFFAPYALLLIPLIFSQMKRNELKAIYMIGAVALLILYNFVVLSGTGYDPYYFIWQAR